LAAVLLLLLLLLHLAVPLPLRMTAWCPGLLPPDRHQQQLDHQLVLCVLQLPQPALVILLLLWLPPD
jgi:hypothetical protein